MRWIFLIMVIGYISTVCANELNSSNTSKSFWETYTAALRGDKVAQFQVGVIYERGVGIEANQTQAAQWFEKSALQGYVDAQYNIALMYASGRGVVENEGIAMMWLARAAKQGDGEARKLLLRIIDGGLKTDNKGEAQAVGSSGDVVVENITPVTLIAKTEVEVCDSMSKCIPYRENSVFTSKSKRGDHYKISGIVTKKGWTSYDKEGWIDETSVEVRR